MCLEGGVRGCVWWRVFGVRGEGVYGGGMRGVVGGRGEGVYGGWVRGVFGGRGEGVFGGRGEGCVCGGRQQTCLSINQQSGTTNHSSKNILLNSFVTNLTVQTSVSCLPISGGKFITVSCIYNNTFADST